MYLNFDDLEISVEDGNAPIKLIFIPDYLKSRDLTHCTLRITPWHDYTFRVIQRELKNNSGQHGITFIRRRLIKYGLGLLEKDNTKSISIIQNKYNDFLAMYDRKTYRKFHQNNLSIGDSDFFRKTDIYMEEDDFGRISDLADILHVHQSSIMRVSLAYSIKNLDCFGDDVMLEAVDDIENFRTHLHKTSQ